jgi:hypothetical protein
VYKLIKYIREPVYTSSYMKLRHRFSFRSINHSFNHSLKKIQAVKVSSGAVVCVFLLVLAFSLNQIGNVLGLSAIGPWGAWYEMPGRPVYFQSCSTGSDGGSTCTCYPANLNAFFPYPGPYAPYSYIFSDPDCLSRIQPQPEPFNFYKTVICPWNYGMIGIRFYAYYEKVDEEHVDAFCAPLQGGVSVSVTNWYEAPNAYTPLGGGYKEVICPPGQILIATRMYGIYHEVDEEHVDGACASLYGQYRLGGAYWAEPSNAWNTLYGGYKEATCPIGFVMVGLRWYEMTSQVDEEHVDALCQVFDQSTPTVQVNISR